MAALMHLGIVELGSTRLEEAERHLEHHPRHRTAHGGLLKDILAVLGVYRHTEAVERARELGLLAPSSRFR